MNTPCVHTEDRTHRRVWTEEVPPYILKPNRFIDTWTSYVKNVKLSKCKQKYELSVL